MFKKKHDVGGLAITAGTDLDGKKSITLQMVDGERCICVHKCKIEGGLHWSKMDASTLEVAIPYEDIIPLLDRL